MLKNNYKLSNRLPAIGLLMIYILSIFIISFGNSAIVSAVPVKKEDVSNNLLYMIAKGCNGMKKGDGAKMTLVRDREENAYIEEMKGSANQWRWCETMQSAMKDQIGNSCDKLFKGRTDPNDSSRNLDWNVDPGALRRCYDAVENKLTKLASTRCSSMFRGDGEDSDAWKDCEKEQNRLYEAMGCSKRMFIERTDRAGYWTQDSDAVQNCRQRTATIANTDIAGPAGTGGKKISEIAASAEESSEKDQADCDMKASSPMSWIICPVIDLGANLTDFVFRDIVSPLLKDVPVSTDRESGSYKVWEQFRFLANILLIGTLLAIVYSQARGEK